ncbi:MAG: hypothetical protein PWQ50_153 [Methanolobus sp.]|jgi:hypothetical protein|nr:hypothetical protein [Methanolobus sp.]
MFLKTFSNVVEGMNYPINTLFFGQSIQYAYLYIPANIIY